MAVEVKKVKEHQGKSSKSDKAVKKSTPQKKTKRLKISFLTVLLVIFIVQLFFGLLINSAKIYSLKTKISTLEDINKTAERKNKHLRDELEKYSSNSGVEALARNRLQFSKEDETLVIIKTPQKEQEP